MGRQDQQEQRDPTQLGAEESQETGQLAGRIAELERLITGVRDSVEHLKGSLAGKLGGTAETAPRQTAGGEAEAEAHGEESAAGASEGQEAAQGEEEEGAEPQPGERIALFDGTEASMDGWRKVGAGEFEYRDGALLLRPGRDRGLAYHAARHFADFRLEARYRLENSEVPVSAALRFLDPEHPVSDREHPETKYRYDNQAYVAAHTGFEVNLGASGDWDPGTFVGIAIGDDPGAQQHPESVEVKTDDWNDLEIEVRGEDFTVRLNGAQTAHFTNTDQWRGRSSATDPEAGHIGILMGEQPRASRQAAPATRPSPGPLPSKIAGPIVPGRPGRGARGQSGAPSPEKAASDGSLTLGRIEIEDLSATETETEGAGEKKGTREAAGKVGEGRKKKDKEKGLKKLGPKDRAALHEEVRGALARLKAKDSGIEGMLAQAYGYAVLPSVGRASLLLGGARGYGEVFEQGKPIGFTRVTQLTFGVQVGGQTFTELVLFGSKESLDAFKKSPMAFNANLSAVFIRGASGTTDFKDVTAHSYSRGGMLLEASLGGQKFRFMNAAEVEKEFAKLQERETARARVTQAGRAAKGFASTLSSKASDFMKKQRSD